MPRRRNVLQWVASLFKPEYYQRPRKPEDGPVPTDPTTPQPAGTVPVAPESASLPPPVEATQRKTSPRVCAPANPPKHRDQPYFFQVGFDFGTSYSKSVCRDLITDRAWVHVPAGHDGAELPFLVPSALRAPDGCFARLRPDDPHYPEDGLYHLKLALQKIALGQLDDTDLAPYRARCGGSPFGNVVEYTKAAATFLLACAFGDVREEIRYRFPDYGAMASDYIAINMAIPVADANNLPVSALFQEVLVQAWALSERLAGSTRMGLCELRGLLAAGGSDPNGQLAEACSIYPEVSANVQGYVRSRASSPGIFLLSDAGAGSVDQSVFIFVRDGDTELLTYLHGSVLPLGSSRIERTAAEIAGAVDAATLENWRTLKERGHRAPELESARDRIAAELGRGTHCTFAMAKKKLYFKDQMLELRLIYAGGGHCEHPYESGIISQLDGQLFSRPIPPRVTGLPVPRDLELQDHQRRWMPRLSVAYGLSFQKDELARFILPNDLPNPRPEEIWQPMARIRTAPTKDEC